MNTHYNATLTHRADVVPGTIVVRIQHDEGGFTFEPGQYSLLGLKASAQPSSPLDPQKDTDPNAQEKLITRAYSITSNSTQQEIEFMITLIPSGQLTPRLFQLNVGDRLFMQPKASGVFTLRRASGNRDVLLIATGTALAPYLSMIRSQELTRPDFRFVVIHAAEVSWDLILRPQLEALTEKTKYLTYIPTITRPEKDRNWHGLTGSIEQIFKAGDVEDELGMPITPDRFDIFLAGNPQMIDAMICELTLLDFTMGPVDDEETNIFVERYW